MNEPNRTAIVTFLLTVVQTTLLKAAPFFKPEYAETIAAAIAWLATHWSG